MPRHGIFVEQRLRQLLTSGRIAARVVAPVPWFPLTGHAFGEYGAWARVPRAEMRHGIAISHPRYAVIPKVGMSLAPMLMYRGVRRHVQDVAAEMNGPHLIDSHYLYPDGVAAVRLGRELGLPVVVTARGSDVSLIPRYRLPRRSILKAANECAGIVAVSQDLKQSLVSLGVSAERITVLGNGVDLELFRPVEATALRSQLGRGRHVLLAVGHLNENKGHHLAIEGLRSLLDCQLVIVGDGGMRAALQRLARSLDVEKRVTFVRHINHEELPAYYSAADALVLMSAREGMPNVLLESIACGTPAVATRAGGAAEIMADPAAGMLLPERSAAALADGVRSLLRSRPDTRATRAYAQRFSWAATTLGQVELFERVAAEA